MRLGWDEIRLRAKAFTDEWKGAAYEKMIQGLGFSQRGLKGVKRPARRMYFACTHVTLRATEVPVWLDMGMEVIPEEVDTGTLNVFEALQYDDPDRHPILRQCTAASTLPAHSYHAVRRCRLRQRQGQLSTEEQQFFNSQIDVIYIPTDLALAVAIKRWFAGEVIFRYFGTFENLRNLRDMVAEHEPEALADIVCLPIFNSLYELGIHQAFSRSATVHGFIGKANLPTRWQGIRTRQSAVVVMNHVVPGTAQAEMLRRMLPLAAQIPISVLGKNLLDQLPTDIAANLNVRGFLDRAEFLNEFAGCRMLIHPHAERHHNHYSNLEAVAMGIPVLFRTDNPLYLEQPEKLRLKKPAEWFGAFASEAELFSAAARLFDNPQSLCRLAKRQRRLLDPYSRRAVVLEAKQAAILLKDPTQPRMPVGQTDWIHSRLPCGQSLHLQQEFAATGGSIPFHAVAIEADWQLLSEDAGGALVISMPANSAARRFLFGNGLSLRPGHYQMALAGGLLHSGIAQITLEVFTAAGCSAVHRFRVSAHDLPELSAAELWCPDNWLLCISVELLYGDGLDLSSLTLLRLGDHLGAPSITSTADAAQRLLGGDRIPLAMLAGAPGDHRIAWQDRAATATIIQTLQDPPVQVLLGDQQAFAPGRYALEIEAEAKHHTTLLAAFELFQDAGIAASCACFAGPGNDGKIVIQADINATQSWTVLINLRTGNHGEIFLGLVRLTALGNARSAPSLVSEQTGTAAFLAGCNVPIEAMLSFVTERVDAAPAQLILPDLGRRWTGFPLRLSASFNADTAVQVQIQAELWGQRGIAQRTERSATLCPGRNVIYLDFDAIDPDAAIKPVLFIRSDNATLPMLTHLRLAFTQQPWRAAGAAVSHPATNDILEPDMQFYGQFNPPVDRFIFERYFPDTAIHGVFVECGGFDGVTDSSCKFFEESMGWTGFNLEPVPNLFALLEHNRPLARNLQAALSDRTGDAVFTHAIHPTLGALFGNGSLTHATAHREELEQADCSFETLTVATITWRDFIKQEAIETVDLLVLDVEGHELTVLEGMRGSDVLPAVMCVEFGHLGLGTVRTALRELGYEYDIQSHGNAYFVRRDLLGLFALRRAATVYANFGSDADRSAASLAEGALTPGKPVSVASFAPAETISASVYGDEAYAGVAIATDAMTTFRLPTLGSGRLADVIGFDLHLAAAEPGSLSLVLENWDDTGVHSRAVRTSTIAAGPDIVSIIFPSAPAGTALNPVLFLQVSSGCDALLTHLQLRVKTAAD